MTNKNLIDIFQIAELADCHLATAYRIVKRDGFPSVFKPNYRTKALYNRDEVMAWLNANGYVCPGLVELEGVL